MVGGSQRNERNFLMNHTDGWMGGGMWIWTSIGVLVPLVRARSIWEGRLTGCNFCRTKECRLDQLDVAHVLDLLLWGLPVAAVALGLWVYPG